MGGGLSAASHGTEHVSRDGPSRNKETDMTWQPPQAQDFRFGFEITMYIAAR